MKDYLRNILVLAVVMLSFFASNIRQFTGSIPSDVEADITEVSCHAAGTSFQVCETVTWNGLLNYYAKGLITNGEKLSQSPQQLESPFTYCQDVGTREGKRATNVYVFDGDGILRLHKEGLDVDCRKNNAQASSSLFEKQLTFRSEPDRQYNKGSLLLQIDLPDKPVSCDLEGTWITDNAKYRNLNQQYCHKATGHFTAHIDKSKQYVDNDADSFRWAGESLPVNDPAVEHADEYVVSMKTCDTQYYTNGGRYYVQGKIFDFSEHMKIQVDYYNDDTHPAVDFIVHVQCRLASQEQEVPVVTAPRVVVQHKEEPAKQEEKPVQIRPFEQVYEQPGFFVNIWQFFRHLFSGS